VVHDNLAFIAPRPQTRSQIVSPGNLQSYGAPHHFQCQSRWACYFLDNQPAPVTEPSRKTGGYRTATVSEATTSNQMAGGDRPASRLPWIRTYAKSATWVCGTCRSRKVINYHIPKLHRLVKNLITQATTGADVVDEHGKVIHEGAGDLTAILAIYDRLEGRPFLEKRFGANYLSYKGKVRRWL
jgi:hypothetical protein